MQNSKLKIERRMKFCTTIWRKKNKKNQGKN